VKATSNLHVYALCYALQCKHTKAGSLSSNSEGGWDVYDLVQGEKTGHRSVEPMTDGKASLAASEPPSGKELPSVKMRKVCGRMWAEWALRVQDLLVQLCVVLVLQNRKNVEIRAQTMHV
jgi:hypothetical protein